MIGAGQAPERLTCSRAGCLERATWRVEWRNPKIHAEDRVKVWLACDEHVDYLREFLAAREFPLRVAAASEPSGGAIPGASGNGVVDGHADDGSRLDHAPGTGVRGEGLSEGTPA